MHCALLDVVVCGGVCRFKIKDAEDPTYYPTIQKCNKNSIFKTALAFKSGVILVSIKNIRCVNAHRHPRMHTLAVRSCMSTCTCT